MMEGKTCILIVHRLQMAQGADRVVVLGQGRVAEAGSHESLLSTDGTLYRAIYAEQYGEDRLPPTGEGQA